MVLTFRAAADAGAACVSTAMGVSIFMTSARTVKCTALRHSSISAALAPVVCLLGASHEQWPGPGAPLAALVPVQSVS